MARFAGVDLDDLEFHGRRLTLRAWRPEDADAVLAAMQDRSMHRFLVLPDPYTAEDADAFVSGIGDEGRAEGTGVGCALVENATGAVIGSAALRFGIGPPRLGTASLGYAVYPGHQGRGYAAEAVGVLTEWGFEHGLHRVEIECAVDNLASARTALNSGFRFEGVRRGGLRVPGGPVDAALFGRTVGDPPGRVPPSFTPLPAGGLTDGAVLLRPVLPEDAEALFEEYADALTVANGFTGVAPTRAEIAAAASRAGLDWLVGAAALVAVVDVASGEVAGSIRLRHAGPPGVGGIGYSINPRFRGRGTTAAALRLLVSWAFEKAGFARLELGAKTANRASQRAALAAGFRPDGIRSARLRDPDGSYSDEVRFALVNPQIARRISP